MKPRLFPAGLEKERKPIKINSVNFIKMSDRDSVVTVDELDESEDRGHDRGKESRRDGFEGGRDRSEGVYWCHRRKL